MTLQLPRPIADCAGRSHDARRALAGAAGQAAVELVVFVPLALAAALAAAAILAHAAAEEHAGEAAQAGAMALLQDRDARAAARAALPERERGAARITLSGRRIEVQIPSRLPLGAVLPRLTATAAADAGPEPVP